VTGLATDEQALERWLANINRRNRRSRVIARTLRGERRGILTLPVAFAVKVVEVGPTRAIRIAVSVVRERLGPK
jgi:hypothetical protein